MSKPSYEEGQRVEYWWKGDIVTGTITFVHDTVYEIQHDWDGAEHCVPFGMVVE